LVHPLGELDVVFVGRDLHAGMQKAIQLFPNGRDDGFASMPNVDAANAPGKIYVAIPVDILQPSCFRFCDIYRRTVRYPAGHGYIASLGQRF